MLQSMKKSKDNNLDNLFTNLPKSFKQQSLETKTPQLDDFKNYSLNDEKLKKTNYSEPKINMDIDYVSSINDTNLKIKEELTVLLDKLTKHEGIDDLVVNLKDKYDALMNTNEKSYTDVKNEISGIKDTFNKSLTYNDFREKNYLMEQRKILQEELRGFKSPMELKNCNDYKMNYMNTMNMDIDKHVETKVCAPVEEKMKFEVETKEKSHAKKKKTYQKISTPETIDFAVKKIKEKFPLFPLEYQDKLYTGDSYFVDFKKSKLELTDGGVILKLINSLN